MLYIPGPPGIPSSARAAIACTDGGDGCFLSLPPLFVSPDPLDSFSTCRTPFYARWPGGNEWRSQGREGKVGVTGERGHTRGNVWRAAGGCGERDVPCGHANDRDTIKHARDEYGMGGGFALKMANSSSEIRSPVTASPVSATVAKTTRQRALGLSGTCRLPLRWSSRAVCVNGT